MQNYAKIGVFGILALVALRVAIGWHFYMEGVAKVRGGGNFSSEGFLASAQGPLADKFQQLIWDHDGRLRLDKEKTVALFEAAAKDSIEHFKWTADQQEKVKQLQDATTNKLNDIYAAADEDLYKYWQSVERLEKMRESPVWNEISSLRGQRLKIEGERLAPLRPTLAAVDAMWKQYEGQLNQIPDKTQRQATGSFDFGRPGEGPLSASTVDRIIPIFDMTVGILLMIGLLTPLASWAAALFLLGVVLSQMPGYPGTQPTYFQVAEALALVVLATTDAGRYAGLDFIPWAWWNRRKAKKAGSQATPAVA